MQFVEGAQFLVSSTSYTVLLVPPVFVLVKKNIKTTTLDIPHFDLKQQTIGICICYFGLKQLEFSILIVIRKMLVKEGIQLKTCIIYLLL